MRLGVGQGGVLQVPGCSGRPGLDNVADMRMPLAKATLFDANSESDFTLLEDHGQYFVSAGNRIGSYRDFIQVLFDDDGLFLVLVATDAQANFLVLMESLA